ncbi:MAG: PRC-barrel domain-containing protein [Sphingomonadaceae bacterium]|nr:PRC-barrel domain-containing protein [Sphingomonadaceae bacterium]
MAGIMPVGGICGTDVAGADGESLGSISELMIDSGSGGVAYAVLAYGGLLGVGEKLFAVPWRAFDVDAASGAIKLSVPRERLDALPGFDKDAWPTEPDPAFE